jgi:hypothetical protein
MGRFHHVFDSWSAERGALCINRSVGRRPAKNKIELTPQAPRDPELLIGQVAEVDIYSQVPVNDIPAMKLAAASSQSCDIARLKANQRSPFILQTQ